MPSKAKRGHQIPRSWSYLTTVATQCGCWGLDLGPLQEQEVLLSLLKCYILNRPTPSHTQYTPTGTTGSITHSLMLSLSACISRGADRMVQTMCGRLRCTPNSATPRSKLRRTSTGRCGCEVREVWSPLEGPWERKEATRSP